jgi:hypothetical protein
VKTKFYWIALLVSAAMIAQAKAGGHHGGGGETVTGPVAPARAAAPVSSSASMPNSAGRMMTHSGQSFPQHYSNEGRPIGARQFTPGTASRIKAPARFSNSGSHAIVGPRREVNIPGRSRAGNNLAPNWRNHVVAQHSANWHRDWDRGRDHWWHGHRCRFVNGSWFIFDFGFYPWSPYWYPYDYYGYNYYLNPYGYSPDYYYSGRDSYQDYYDRSRNADQDTDSTVVAAQERLAEEGYYRGEIDSILGPEMRRAIARYQRNLGLRATGYLTRDTIEALGLRQIASNSEP